MMDKKYCYLSSTNEDGWYEVETDNKIGFSPELDKNNIFDKVMGVLGDMVDAKLVYVSNSSQGIGLAETVSKKCRETDRYDQYSIIEFIMGILQSHWKFWQQKSRKLNRGEL